MADDSGCNSLSLLGLPASGLLYALCWYVRAMERTSGATTVDGRNFTPCAQVMTPLESSSTLGPILVPSFLYEDYKVLQLASERSSLPIVVVFPLPLHLISEQKS